MNTYIIIAFISDRYRKCRDGCERCYSCPFFNAHETIVIAVVSGCRSAFFQSRNSRNRRIRKRAGYSIACGGKGLAKKNCSIKENNKWRRFQQVVDVQHIHNTDGPANNNNETRNNNRPSPYYITSALLFVYNVLIILKEKRQNVQQSAWLYR